jgi:hypothetical protein
MYFEIWMEWKIVIGGNVAQNIYDLVEEVSVSSLGLMLLDSVKFSRLMSRKIHFSRPRNANRKAHKALAPLQFCHKERREINPPSRRAADASSRRFVFNANAFFSYKISSGRRRRRTRGSKQSPKSLWSTFSNCNGHTRTREIAPPLRWRVHPNVVTRRDESEAKHARLVSKCTWKTQITIFLRLRWFQFGVAALPLGGFVYTNIFRVEVVAFLLFVDTHPLFIFWKLHSSSREEKNLCCWMLQIITLLSYTVLNPFLLERSFFCCVECACMIIFDTCGEKEHHFRKKGFFLSRWNIFCQIVCFHHSRRLECFLSRRLLDVLNKIFGSFNVDTQKTILGGYIFANAISQYWLVLACECIFSSNKYK